MQTELYNLLMVWITGAYLLATFLLFFVGAYETWYRPKAPEVRVYPHRSWWDWRMVDFIVHNEGVTLSNVRITSSPTDLGWGDGNPAMLSSGLLISNEGIPPISSLGRGEIHRHFWRVVSKDLHEIEDLFARHSKVSITLRFDNPQRILGWIGKRQRTLTFDFNKPTIAAYLGGIRGPLDLHQIARELHKIREHLEQAPK